MADTKSSLTTQQARAIKNLAGKYNTKTAEADQLREQLDDVVFDARVNGNGTFREIAALSNRSIAWVQGSLERSKRRRAKK